MTAARKAKGAGAARSNRTERLLAMIGPVLHRSCAVADFAVQCGYHGDVGRREMIIERSAVVRDKDLTALAWSGLRRFHDIEYVVEHIRHVHGIKTGSEQNIKKQATQIRYCLLQAREYFEAATSVGLATKPNLLYYCAMSLALAEVLLKQDGLSSLDRAREQHRHHGLELWVDESVRTTTLSASGSALKALPIEVPRNGALARKGTFELWHRTARETPLLGKMVLELKGTPHSSTSYRTILPPADQRIPLLPSAGITLFNCLQCTPGMVHYLEMREIPHGLIRAVVDYRQPADRRSNKIWITVHPGNEILIKKFMENCKFDANSVDRITIDELPHGFILEMNNNDINGNVIYSIPAGVNWTKERVFFWPEGQPLNEFGFFYVALFIVGNYARYFPDRWVRDTERSTPLALAIEELLRVAEVRMPLLTYSEMSRTYYVPEG